MRALAQAPRELGLAPPPSPKCPTNQMTSIPEVIPAGGGGSDKVTFPLSSPPPASRQLSPHSPFSLFSQQVCIRPLLYASCIQPHTLAPRCPEAGSGCSNNSQVIPKTYKNVMGILWAPELRCPGSLRSQGQRTSS